MAKKAKTRKAKGGKVVAKKAKAKKVKTGKAVVKKAKAKKVGAKLRAMRTGHPPYKCQTTDEPGVCLRFNRNPRTGQYNLPPGGIRVKCTDCEFFFD